jgi:hypothetical protein
MTKFKIAPWKAELWQAGVIVAKVEGPTQAAIGREIQHYAMMYVQDGPVEVKIKPPARS